MVIDVCVVYCRVKLKVSSPVTCPTDVTTILT